MSSTKYNDVIDSFLNHLWSVQYVSGDFVIFVKSSVFLGDNVKKDACIIWNQTKPFRQYHTHVKDYKTALEIVGNIHAKRTDTITKGWQLQHYLRIIDLYDKLWYTYIDLVFEKNLIVENIIKYEDGMELVVNFNLYYPCPKCGGKRHDHMPLGEFRCCHRCNHIWYYDDDNLGGSEHENAK